MKIMLLLTADYASIEPFTKKLNVIGAFDRILGKSFPCEHKRLALAIKIRAELEDHHDERTLAIEMIDEDGTQLLHISGPFRFSQTGTGMLGEHAAVLELNNLTFPQSGIYNFVVYADGEELGRTPIELVQFQQNSE